MRSQRNAFFLALLLVLSLVVTAALGMQLQGVQQLRETVEGFQAEQATQQALFQEDLKRIEEQRDDIDAELSEAQSTLRDLRSRLERVEQQRNELEAERNELRQKNEQLELLLQNLNSMNQINQQVVGLRELQPQNRVPRDVLTRHEFRQRLTADLEEDFPVDDEQRERAKLIALDMLDPNIDLRSAIVDDSVNSVLGFYDPRTKELFVISDRGSLGVEDRITYAHEYIHFLQDETFNLALLQSRAPNSDASMALRALIEGDASLGMYFWANDYLNEFDRLNYALEQIERLGDYFGSISYSGGDTVVESIGAFPYTTGTDFVYGLYLSGGWRAVNRAYSNPPLSTAQILHPELYYQGIQPVAVGLPNLQAALGAGWSQVDNDVLGELYLRVYLEHEVEFNRSISAANGWRGDRYSVLQGPDGSFALAIRVAMSSNAEAAELFEAYSIFAAEKGGVPTATYSASRRLWELPQRQIYLSQAGREVLILHAPSAPDLAAMRGAFPGF